MEKKGFKLLDYRRGPWPCRCVADATEPEPVAGDAGNCAPPPALASSSVWRYSALLLPDRGGGDCHLTYRGCSEYGERQANPQLPPLLSGKRRMCPDGNNRKDSQ